MGKGVSDKLTEGARIKMAELDLQKNLEMPTCGRWAEVRGQEGGQTVANKESRDRGHGSCAEAKTVNKVSGVEYCKIVQKDTGLRKKQQQQCA